VSVRRWLRSRIGHRLPLKTPQVLTVDRLGDFGIDPRTVWDTKTIRRWDVMGEIRKRVKKAFDEEDIEMP
jgi:small-conductance mechanosensitive channel